MADVFVRRTTGFLLFLVFLLSVVCVALVAMLVGREPKSPEPNLVGEHIHVTDKERLKSTENNAYTPHAMVQTTTEAIPSTEADSKMEPWEKNIRIPTTTNPYHYDLLLHPNLETESFTGKVAILIGVTSPMNYLLAHVKLMNITSTELRDSSGMKYELTDAFEYKPNEFWVVRPAKILEPGNYTLTIAFDGSLRGHITGFYMSEYTTKSGEKRAIATSKFQPTDARRAFPCFDEPSFKSTFKTTLVRPSQGYIALSNMPVQKEIPDSPSPGLTKVEFQNSVPMVTYLACFIVCDFDFVEVMTKDLKPFRVYATKDQINRATYARDIGVDILNYFESYFEVKYPLPKQDMIAIPDFSSGAMEHWGLITYRETNLLYDEVNSSSYNKQRVAAVVSHELAHMWFGNLVTLEWWDDLWLNEGFASYIEYKGVANYEKDWDMLDQFLSSDLHSVFQLDQILNSHPIVQPVNHPNEITEIFDKISYSKGASVLRMLEDFIGAETFRIGVRNFLKRFAFRNAVTQDLWDDLQKVSSANLNITRIMDTWTRQMGFPVLNVKTSMENKNKLEVSQKRFLIDPGAQSLDDSPYGYKWDVPVTMMTKNLKREQVWLKMEDEKIMLDRPIGSDWIKLNVDQYGYYRVNYDEGLWTELINALQNNHEMLSPSDRANLIDDSFSLAAAGQLSYNVAFQTISYLPRETHFVPWSATHEHLQNLGHYLRNTKAYTFFRKYVVRLADKHVDRVRWEDTGTHTERRNRANILSLACSNGHQICLEGAVTKFKDWIRNPQLNAIPANLRSIIYNYGIKETGEVEWNELLKRYINELNAQEKSKMLRGLASTSEPWIANRLMNLGRNESIIRRQDYLTMIYYLSANPSTISESWSFIRGNWEWLIETFGLDSRYLGRVVRYIGYQFTSRVQLEEMEAFFKKYPEAGAGTRARQQALEKIHQNIKWIESYAEPLYMWLKKNSI